MPGLESLLTERLSAAFAAVAGEPVDPTVRRSQRADFQANGALALAKRLGRNPREVAGEIVAAAEAGGLRELVADVEIAGPGFLNLTLSDAALGELAASLVGDERLGVAPSDEPDVVVVDYSAPNAAKEMHVGHLRSTIIGDAIVRLLEWRGHTVIRQNHIGEWGTPFGMLIEHLLDVGEAEAAQERTMGDLNAFYKAARRKFDADEAFQERSRARVVLLQSGDEDTLRLWELLVEQSKTYFLSVYERLDVRLDEGDFAGESMYNDQLAATAEELAERGLLREDDGAQCVFPEGFRNRDGDPLPMIVIKSDGGFGYDTTDLAALRYRTHDLKATRLLYVVGAPQQTHFAMLFEIGREAGWLNDSVRAEHVSFGSVLGTDGKMLRTRAGASIRLIELLDEAVARAAAEVATRNPDLPADEAAAVAEAVGIGAVKYADLSTDRNKDYVFDYDRMLSFDGNTAPYLQYAHTRIQSIFRRAEVAPEACTGPIVVAEPAERELAIELLSLADLLADVERDLELHRLCTYLYGVATAFTSFYEHCPVLRAEDESVRASRLALCALTARTLALGLSLVGIKVPSRM
ncbi:MAG TPA: arginine--tRNA ligase [Acidimicrobiales bacterium]|nr:arginine--tRNA ligase [Acidimicrobiales bacterium]